MSLELTCMSLPESISKFYASGVTSPIIPVLSPDAQAPSLFLSTKAEGAQLVGETQPCGSGTCFWDW